MAVMDQQDSFSNLSFNSDQNMGGGSSASAHYDGEDAGSPGPLTHQEHQEPDSAHLQQLDPGLGGEILECVVTEPHTENVGTKDAYVSYLITTNVRSCTTWLVSSLILAVQSTNVLMYSLPSHPFRSPSLPSVAVSPILYFSRIL